MAPLIVGLNSLRLNNNNLLAGERTRKGGGDDGGGGGTIDVLSSIEIVPCPLYFKVTSLFAAPPLSDTRIGSKLDLLFPSFLILAGPLLYVLVLI